MIDLNEYLTKTVEVKIEDAVIHVKLPSCNVMAEIGKIEDSNKENNTELYYKNRQKIARVLLNYNMENRAFTDDEMDVFPSKAINTIIDTVMKARIGVALDPNSDSQSQTETSAKPL